MYQQFHKIYANRFKTKLCIMYIHNHFTSRGLRAVFIKKWANKWLSLVSKNKLKIIWQIVENFLPDTTVYWCNYWRMATKEETFLSWAIFKYIIFWLAQINKATVIIVERAQSQKPNSHYNIIFNHNTRGFQKLSLPIYFLEVKASLNLPRERKFCVCVVALL